MKRTTAAPQYLVRSFTFCAAWLSALCLASVIASAQNLAQNPGFESGTTGWVPWGSVTFTAPTTLPHTGTRSAFVTNRTATWNGVAQSLLGVLQNTNTYRISAWVRLGNSASQTAMLTMQKIDGSGTNYANVATGTATSNAWTQISGGYTLNVSGTLTALNLYVEGPAVGVTVYADDFDVEQYDWKGQANARIEQVRKRDVRVVVVDTAGNPVPGVTVSARQTKHRFGLGSAVNNNISNPTYASFFKTNFEWAVMENESKWYYNEPTQGNVTYTVADSITNFCYTNGITLRGHCIFWAVDANVQTWVKSLSNTGLTNAISNRLSSAVTHFKGTFKHWDVNNEMLHGNYFGNRLGNWVNPWMFQRARELDAGVQLFVNDYNVITYTETAAYVAQIQSLLASNAPVGGIGAQGHFGATIDPLTTEIRMDSLGSLGIPLWVTEYDSTNADPVVRGDNLETMYRLAFSKSYCDGVMMWGFWAGSHWRGSNAAIVDLNWTINAAGQRYQSLLSEWTTVTNGVTDGAGAFGFRGFQGDYDVTLTPPGGLATLRRFTLDPGSGTNFVTLISHLSGAQPVLHGAVVSPADGRFRFQLTGDAGPNYAIQTSTDLALMNGWSPVTNLANPYGTTSFTNPTPASESRLFFRAKRLP